MSWAKVIGYGFAGLNAGFVVLNGYFTAQGHAINAVAGVVNLLVTGLCFTMAKRAA